MDNRPIISKRLNLILALIFLLLSTPLSAQWWVKPRSGFWLGLDLEAGATLLSQDKSIKKDNHLSTGFGLTLGYHFRSIPSLSLGLGINNWEFANPDELSYLGVHLLAAYSPISTLEALRLRTRISISHLSNDGGGYKDRTYLHTNFLGDISVGWELRHLVGQFGIQPSIGVSLLTYRYEHPSNTTWSNLPQGSGRGTQLMPFVRLSLFLN